MTKPVKTRPGMDWRTGSGGSTALTQRRGACYRQRLRGAGWVVVVVLMNEEQRVQRSRLGGWWVALGVWLVAVGGAWAQGPAPRVWVGPVDAGSAAGASLLARSLDEGVRQDLGRRSAVVLAGQGLAGQGRAASVAAGEVDPRVEQAERLRVAAKEAFGRGDHEGALRQLRAALELYEEGLASVNKLEAVFETLGYLGAASQASGYDADAEDFFRRVVAVAPDAEPLDEFSAAAQGVFREERAKLLEKKRGTLRVVTEPSGARVRIDGIDMGRSPLVVPRLVRGDHYVQAEDAEAGLAGARVAVKGGGTSEVVLILATELGPPPAEEASAEEKAALVAMARVGELGEPFRELAEVVAGKAQADFVVVSHISPRGNGFVLGAFFYGVEQKQVAAFDEFAFRADLNSVAVQAARFAAAIVEAVGEFPQDKVVVGRPVAVAAPLPPVVAPPAFEAPEPEPAPPEPEAPIERAPVRQSTPVPLAVEREEAAEADEGVGAWVWVVGGVVVAGGAVAAAVLLSEPAAPSKRFDAEVRW